MVKRANAIAAALLIAALGLASGCAELGFGTDPPSAAADRAPPQTTAAKTVWSSNTSGKMVRMEILPVEATSPVQTPQILIASVHDQDGSPCRNCRIAWKLEGAGEIVAVDESDTRTNAGQLINRNSAISYTESADRRVSRTGDPASAFLVKPGQSWCVITSSVPGDSQVIAHVAENPNRSVIVRHWVEDGRASPRASAPPASAGITLANYQEPAIFLTPNAPTTVSTGQSISCSVTVSNASANDSHGLMVRAAIPDGLQYVESKPKAVVEGKQLVWTIDQLPARHSQELQIFYKSTRPGTYTHRAALSSGDGAADEKTCQTDVTNAQLKIGVTGPVTGTIGVPATYEITIRNLGTGPATNVMLTDALDPGLEHATKSNPIELPLGTLAPGEKRTASLILTPRNAGALSHHLTVTADGNLKVQADSTLTVQAGQIDVHVLGPNLRYVGRPAVWDIQVNNPSTTPVTNVAVSAVVPPELTIVSVSEGGQASGNQRGGEVHWRIGTLNAHEQKVVQVTARCELMAEKSQVRATVTADPNVQVRAEAALAVRGLPAFRVHVVDLKDPIQIGERTTYKIDVSNEGTLPGHQVEITAEAPPQLHIVGARGPSQARVEGQRIAFPPVESLSPSQTLTYQVEVEALQPNDALFRVELRSSDLTDPIAVEESTTIYSPGGPVRMSPPNPATNRR